MCNQVPALVTNRCPMTAVHASCLCPGLAAQQLNSSAVTTGDVDWSTSGCLHGKQQTLKPLPFSWKLCFFGRGWRQGQPLRKQPHLFHVCCWSKSFQPSFWGHLGFLPFFGEILRPFWSMKCESCKSSWAELHRPQVSFSNESRWSRACRSPQIDWPMTSAKCQGWAARQQLWKSTSLCLMSFFAET